jgi:hypothetical protein
MSPSRNWDSPNPSLASECAPPPRTGGGGGSTHACGWRVRGYPIPTTWEKLSTLPSLCSHALDWGRPFRGGWRYQKVSVQDIHRATAHVPLSHLLPWQLCLHGTPSNVRFQNVRFQNVRFQNVRNVRFTKDVRFTKRQVYKTAGLQNIRLQNVRFQNVLNSKYFETSLSIEIHWPNLWTFYTCVSSYRFYVAAMGAWWRLKQSNE